MDSGITNAGGELGISRVFVDDGIYDNDEDDKGRDARGLRCRLLDLSEEKPFTHQKRCITSSVCLTRLTMAGTTATTTLRRMLD